MSHGCNAPLRGNSTGHAPRCRLRSVLHPSSYKGELHRARVQELHRARAQVHRARAQVSPPRRSESVQLRGNSAQVSPPRRSELHGARAQCQVSKRPQSVRVGRTSVSRRQAKGKLHRARAQVSPSQRSESVKLRGNSTGRVSRNSTHAPSVPSAAFRIRPAKGELRPAEGGLHWARAQVSKRPQSVRVCRTGESRRQAITGNSTGHAPSCRLLRSGCVARV